MFLFPLYAIYKGWGDEFYGFVLALGGYAAMAVMFFLGMIVDIRFKRTTMIIGVIATILSAIFFTRINQQIVSLIFYCLYSIGQQLMRLSTNTYIANESKKGQERTKKFSAYNLVASIARTIAPLSCGYLLLIPVLDFDWVFTIIAVFALVSLILVTFLKLAVEDTPEEELGYAEKISEDSGDDYTEFNDHDDGKKAILGVQISFGIGKVLMGFASGVAIPFISWYILKEFNPSSDVWGLITSLSWAVMAVGYLLHSLYAEKIGKALVVVISWLLVVPMALGIMLVDSFFWVTFFYIARSFFAMTPGGSWNSFQMEWIPPKNRGKVLGLLQTGQRGMRATGTLIGGYIFALLGTAIFPVAMVFYPLAGIIPLVQSKIVKKKLGKEEKKVEEQKEEKYEEIKGKNKEFIPRPASQKIE
ncbi:MFS transporter [Candidatus Heimdallarchaeota archaeon]|nr:MAG: MFS transporter [Candidatus Heimdallarchaeota archaeon]